MTVFHANKLGVKVHNTNGEEMVEMTFFCLFVCLFVCLFCLTLRKRGMKDRTKRHRRHICTMVQNNKESRLKYWATSSFVRLFACTAHLFACSLTSLAPLLVGK